MRRSTSRCWAWSSPAPAPPWRPRAAGRVGVIGTVATVESGSYQRAIAAINPQIEVQAVACPLFVPLAEEGWTEHAVTRAVAEEYLAPLRDGTIDALVLGCTHYPVLKTAIGEVMGEGVTLVDSAEEVVRDVARELEQLPAAADAAPTRRYFVSDIPARFETVGSRFLGAPMGPWGSSTKPTCLGSNVPRGRSRASDRAVGRGPHPAAEEWQATVGTHASGPARAVHRNRRAALRRGLVLDSHRRHCRPVRRHARREGAALPARLRRGLDHRRVRHAAARHPSPARGGTAGNGQVEAVGPSGDPASHRAQSLRSVTDHEAARSSGTVTVDCDVLQADGGTRTAARSPVPVVALIAGGAHGCSTRGWWIAALVRPAGCRRVSVGHRGRDPLWVDLDYVEDSRRPGRHERGHAPASGGLVEVQGTAEGRTFSREELDRMLDGAARAIKKLVSAQREALRAATA